MSGPVVGDGEASLDLLQYETQGCCHREGDQGENPVVGQHHPGDEEHQGAIEQPCQTAPLEELGQGLDIAGDAGDQGTLSLLAVVGDAEAVDVLEQAHPQAVERLLGPQPEAQHCCALSPRGDDDADDGHRPQDGHGVHLHRPAREAAVDGLLDDDGGDHPPPGADQGQDRG